METNNQNLNDKSFAEGITGAWYNNPKVLWMVILGILAAALVGVYFILNQPQDLGPLVFPHSKNPTSSPLPTPIDTITPSVTPTQSISDGTITNYTATASSSIGQGYQVTQLSGINADLVISAFPGSDFIINSIMKVDGLDPSGCHDKIPKAVKDLVSMNDGCFDKSVFLPNTAYSLIAINMEVHNNSAGQIFTSNGDFLDLGYLENLQNKQIFTVALNDIGFRSYGFEPYEKRNIQLSYWVPSETNPLYLAYSPAGTPVNPPPFGQKALENFQGVFKIEIAKNLLSNFN